MVTNNERIRFRRGTAAEWTAAGTTVLASGEPGFETDTGFLKIGDGVKTWAQLDYSNGTVSWDQIDGVPTLVISVNGKNGPTIVLSADDIDDGATNVVMTVAERDKLAVQVDPSLLTAGAFLMVNDTEDGVIPVDPASSGFLTRNDIPDPLVPIYHLNTGDPDPVGLAAEALLVYTDVSNFGFGRVVGSKGQSAVTAATGISIVTTADINAGELSVVAIGASGEGTGAKTTWTVSGPSGTYTIDESAIQGTTMQSAIASRIAGTKVPAGSTITIKPDTDRSDVCVQIQALTGMAASPVDKVAVGGGGNDANFSIGPTALTASSKIVAVAAFVFNPGNRVFAPASGWLLAGSVVVSTDAGPRGLGVIYKILSTTAQVTAGAGVTGTGGVTAWSGSLVCYAGA